MGIPVSHGVADESAEIVEREGVELVFEPEDAEALREGLLRLERDHSLYERLKARSIEAASRYDCGARVPEMLAALEPAAATG